MKIQEDFWTGTKCVENEVPWQTPESVYRLDRECVKSDTVLEIGTGGSTLFYARRCKSVIAIETNPDWFATMSKVFKERGIDNVEYLLMGDQAEIERKLVELADSSIVSVDSVHGYNRSRFLSTIISRNKSFRVLVLDNYADASLFPEHYSMTVQEVINLCPAGGWSGSDYDDPHWCGRGTRVLVKGGCNAWE